MYTKDLVVNDHAEGEKVKHVGKVVPYVCCSVFAHAFCVKAVCLSEGMRVE